MSNSRDIADSAATINFIDTVTSNVQTQLNTLNTAIGSVSVTSGSLTKTFATGETADINLTSSVLAPVVGVTKEVSQVGVTNNNWDASAGSYTLEDSAYATTLTPSATGDGTFTLGSGNFYAADVGKTITGNGGVAVLTTSGGAYVTSTDFTDTSAIASGSWSMFGAVYDATADVLKVSGLKIGFDVSIASFVDSFSIAGQELAPSDLAFNTDGTKMFVLGFDGDKVNEYTLSTGFDVSTATFVDAFSVASQETIPRGLAFNTDGTKMFICGQSSVAVNEYALSTGFDVSTSSYTRAFSVSAQETVPEALAFNTDGTKMFVLGSTGDDVNEYHLTTAFNVSTAGIFRLFSVAAQEYAPAGLAFNTDGTKMFVTGVGSDAVNEYALTTGFNVSTASFTGSFSVATQETDPTGVAFNTDGTKMFIVGFSGDDVNEYNVGLIANTTGYQPCISSNIDSTYWTDINSLTATNAVGDGNVLYAVSNDNRTEWSVLDNTGGTRDIVKNNGGTWQYNSNGTYASETWANATTNTEVAALRQAMEGASNAVGYQLSSASYDSVSFSVASQETDVFIMVFNTDGTKMFVLGYASNTVYQYTLSTAYDISTASYASKSFSVASQASSATALAFNSDGTKMYAGDYSLAKIFQYTLSTAFDVSTASYDSVNFIVSSQVSNSLTSIFFNSNGTKLYSTGRASNSIFQYSLSTAYNLSTASYDSVSFSFSSQGTALEGITFSQDGTKLFMVNQSSNTVYKYNLSTAFNISTMSYASESFDVSSQEPSPKSITFNLDGTKMLIVGITNNTVYQYSTATTGYTNQMNSTTLNAITDANQITLGNDLDFAAILYYASGSTAPTYSGTAINYDANVLNNGAVLGTDYNFDAPAGNKVRITAVGAGNYKVRVV